MYLPKYNILVTCRRTLTSMVVFDILKHLQSFDIIDK